MATVKAFLLASALCVAALGTVAQEEEDDPCANASEHLAEMGVFDLETPERSAVEQRYKEELRRCNDKHAVDGLEEALEFLERVEKLENERMKAAGGGEI